MAEKKKFEKPEMQVIELNSKMQMLAGSGCGENCWDDVECTTDDCTTN
jgi:hypothetical protein